MTDTFGADMDFTQHLGRLVAIGNQCDSLARNVRPVLTRTNPDECEDVSDLPL